ncbi:TIGR00159 family protein [Candidatus Marinamargulisbacteria bacterium SCGC AAA071-K20]|nr:TIGR00159 family protein [Candidatus Marinamargulisbacteria bacterium SCGC AAA071-K20]
MELTFGIVKILYLRLSLVVDFVCVYFLVYRILSWLKQNQTYNVIKGFVLIFLFFLFSYLLKLTTISWVLDKFTTVFIILIIIVFQPELRRFLERLGSSGLFLSSLQAETQNVAVVKHIVRAVENLSKEHIGAIIAIEQATNLDEYISTGILINGEMSSDLLSTLFWKGVPTHDGAVIIRKSRVEAAGCFLPLTKQTFSDRRLGTRHRACLGLSEVSDAIIIVISEENGVISLVERGSITRYLNREALETRLFNLYKEESPKAN